LVLALAGLAASCGDSVRRIADYQNLPGGNPLVPEVAALPYPSDFYLVEDASTPTGRRLQLPDEVMPRSVDATLFQQDGYTIIPAILAYLPGGTDVASLPSPTDHAATIADDSSVMLVREGTWERVGILAELDQTTTDTARQAIIIRPLQALEYETGYVVILRNSLRRLDGTPHEPSEVYAALRDDARTGIDEVDRQRDDFQLVRAAISGTGLDARRGGAGLVLPHALRGGGHRPAGEHAAGGQRGAHGRLRDHQPTWSTEPTGRSRAPWTCPTT
jgi:hypothetical protein